MSFTPDASVDRVRTLRRRTPRRLLLGGLIVGGLIVAVAGGMTLLSPSDVAVSAPPPSMTVTLGAARIHEWPMVIEASGVIAPWQETIIGAQIGGLQLREVRVNVGDHVRKGQVLATFDPIAPRTELARLEAAGAQAKAAVAQAEANRARVESLAGSGAVSDQEVLRLVTEADTARAAAQAAQAAIDAQREQLRYVEVRAPDDGVITTRIASPGAVGGVGQELFRMIRQGRLEWRGEMTPLQLVRVAAGQSVELTLPDGSRAEGRVRQNAPSLDPQTRLGLVYADLTAPGSARAGMYAAGRVRLAETPALTAPAGSVVLRDGRHYVFAVEDRAGARVARAIPVIIGRRQGNEVEILRGLVSDSRIVVSGAGFLKDGDVVREASV